MKKIGQKALVVLLCVCMVLTCMTVSVSAAEEDFLSAILSILDAANAMDKWAQALEYNSADEIMPIVFQDVTGRTRDYNIVRPSKLVTGYTQVLKINLQSICSDWNYNYRHYGELDWTLPEPSQMNHVSYPVSITN